MITSLPNQGASPLKLLGGLVQAEIIQEKNGKAKAVKVDMGKAIFETDLIPVKTENQECIDEMLHLEYKDYLINCVSVGNPHCVILTDNLDEKEVKTFGPQIENHPIFPKTYQCTVCQNNISFRSGDNDLGAWSRVDSCIGQLVVCCCSRYG
jgi:diaminopimelate epimerase